MTTSATSLCLPNHTALVAAEDYVNEATASRQPSRVASSIHIAGSGYAARMTSSRRMGALLLIVGYLGVVGGTMAWVVSWWTSELIFPETIVYQSALAVGIGLAGIACWRWTVASRFSDVEARLVRGPTRWMAAASVGFAAAFAADTYQTYDNHRVMFQHSPPGEGFYPHYRLIIAGGSAFVVGLLLAAVGFWILGTATKATTPAPTLRRDTSAERATTEMEQGPHIAG